jgi:hypothetical protein
LGFVFVLFFFCVWSFFWSVSACLHGSCILELWFAIAAGPSDTWSPALCFRVLLCWGC